MERELQLVVGGARVPLNDFAHRVVLNTLLGLLGSLRDVDTSQEIRIVVPSRP
jgi:hypothetical protein